MTKLLYIKSKEKEILCNFKFDTEYVYNQNIILQKRGCKNGSF